MDRREKRSEDDKRAADELDRLEVNITSRLEEAIKYGQASKKEVEELADQLQRILSHREKLRDENATLKNDLRGVRLQHRASHERHLNVEAEKDREIADLKNEISIKDEQLAGKRALWMDIHPSSSARRSAMQHTIDTSPTPKGTMEKQEPGTPLLPRTPLAIQAPPKFDIQDAHRYFGYKAPDTDGPVKTPSASVRKRRDTTAEFDAQKTPKTSGHKRHETATSSPLPSLPLSHRSRRALNTSDLLILKSLEDSLPELRTEMNTVSDSTDLSLPQYRNIQNALAIADPFVSVASMRVHTLTGGMVPVAPSLENQAPEIQQEFLALFSLCEGWAKVYTSEPNMANEMRIAQSNQRLMSYMMTCAYPGHSQDSVTHVMALLRNGKSRSWFIMRILVMYVANDLMTAESFQTFTPGHDGLFRQINQQLGQQGLNNEARQSAIDKQVDVIVSITKATNYSSFRLLQLNLHSKRLRDLLGPLMNDSANKAEAGRDLAAITIKAWDLTTRMYTSHLNFQVYFPDTASNFNPALMKAIDQPDVEPALLQQRHTRLKLVITPVVTARDDRGTTTVAKNLLLATVLTV